MNKEEARCILERLHYGFYESNEDTKCFLAGLATYCTAILEGITPDIKYLQKRVKGEQNEKRGISKLGNESVTKT